MYDRILVAIDASPDDENRSAMQAHRADRQDDGATVHVLHVARGHIVPGDITGGSGLRRLVRGGRCRDRGSQGRPAARSTS